jgi:hypothetical protein
MIQANEGPSKRLPKTNANRSPTSVLASSLRQGICLGEAAQILPALSRHTAAVSESESSARRRPGGTVGSKRGRVKGDGGYFGADEVHREFQLRSEEITGGLFRFVLAHISMYIQVCACTYIHVYSGLCLHIYPCMFKFVFVDISMHVFYVCMTSCLCALFAAQFVVA